MCTRKSLKLNPRATGDDDVRRIADQRGRAADVGREHLGDQERYRVDAEPVAHQQRHRRDEQHRGYQRRVSDVAVAGARVVIRLTVRRFRCPNLDCPAVTFVEQLPGVTSPHSRYTPQLRGFLTAIGLAWPAGRAGD
jgi:hypothetical protein